MCDGETISKTDVSCIAFSPSAALKQMLLLPSPPYVWANERERGGKKTETQRHCQETQRQVERETHRDTQRQRHMERDRERDRGTDRNRGRDSDTDRDKDRERVLETEL